MEYKSLKKLFHMYGWDSIETEYNMRLNSYSSYVTDFIIHPIQDEKQRLEIKYPLFFVINRALCIRLEKVLNNSDRIKQLSTSLPNVANKLYIKHLLINELQSTNEIENVKSTKKEIAASLNKTKGENKRFDGLVNQYIMLENGNVSFNSVSDIREIFDSIVSSEIKETDLPDGNLFRKNSIGVYDNSKSKWVHRNEFNEPEIFEYLTMLISFIKHYEAPAIYKILASHYMFEYIHPFYDGNGRVGRYILAKLLNDNLDSFTALTFSYVVNNNKNKYYKSFEEASDYFNKGELTNFIDEMMQLLIEGQNNIIETFENNIKIITRLAKSLDQQTLNKYDLDVLFVLLQDKVFGSKYSRISIKEVKDIVGYSRNKVNEVISKYEDKLVKLKSNPVVYEVKDSYVEELLSIELK
ncbi:Fic family protein [Staphylococcus petrasii]|uniref:Fic family protein n=1 Tax=Staphylococcus petrasii TaxID=1276936 RepID=UPI000CD0BB8A|nr:Fic family protein [Staphylococcus petrasii]PNZ83523.1 Fic family protein [Staphylococcus petrasii]TGA82004.1 Fic family protein [Staphylococcus petrasii]SUM60849.1 phage protein [Staphylococcus petrasii]